MFSSVSRQLSAIFCDAVYKTNKKRKTERTRTTFRPDCLRLSGHILRVMLVLAHLLTLRGNELLELLELWGLVQPLFAQSLIDPIV